MVENQPENKAGSVIYSIELEFVNFIAENTLGRKLDVNDLEELEDIIDNSIGEYLADCISAASDWKEWEIKRQIENNDKARTAPLPDDKI
jgi:hypothetical protein